MDDTHSFISLFARFGNHRSAFIKTLQAFGLSAQAVLSASKNDLLETGLKPALVNQLVKPNHELADRCLDWLQAPDHHLLRFDRADYPPILREIADYPALLFARGNLDLLNLPQVAIVGSRLCTAGGAQTARQFAAELSAQGLVITSGLAQGIDAAAHRGALQQHANTIAVMGTGVDRIYPASHRQLAAEIADHGLLISEFPPGTAAAKHHFPRRNRIISGLSLATLVVEASMRSGSLITARLAAEQGREVFAVPASIHNPQARGCHRLIREGATLVDSAEQIVAQLGSLLGYLVSVSQSGTASVPALEAEEESLLRQIAYDPVSVDELSERSGLTIDKLSSILLALELKQVIESAPGGRIVRI